MIRIMIGKVLETGRKVLRVCLITVMSDVESWNPCLFIPSLFKTNLLESEINGWYTIQNPYFI